MFKLANVLLILAGTATALMAGLFFAWSCSVTNGIARLPDSGYIAAFQAMIRTTRLAELDSWLQRARSSLVASFANGVIKNKAAVSAAIT